MRILVAEDEKDLNNIVTEKLLSQSYSVDSCFNGREALEYLNSTSYDCAILDIMMPAMDGLEVVRRLRTSENMVPVIFLTARDAIEDRVTGLDTGANDYLVKPFALDELMARIRALTALSRLGGGIGTRGPGVTKLETDKRTIRKRLSSLRSEVKKLKDSRNTGRQKRLQIPERRTSGITELMPR